MDEFVAMGLKSLLPSYGVPPHLECMILRSNSKNLNRNAESKQKCLESEHKRIEADAELKEEVKNLKSMLEQQVIQMAEQRAHYDNMIMEMLSYITSQSAQSSSDH